MTQNKSARQAMIEAFDEEMEKDERVFVIGEEVGKTGGPYGTTAGLLQKYGKQRVVDTPISEAGFTGIAVGAAFAGLKPVVDFMSWNFALQAMDHIVNSAAKTCFMSNGRIRCPIVFRGPSGYNPGYAAQHVQEFYGWYGSIPGIKVVAPYTPQDHKQLLKSAIRADFPVVFLENEVLYGRAGPVEDGDLVMDLSKAVILKEGCDVTIVGVSLALEMIEQAALATTHSVEIVNLVSIKPIDIETIIKSVVKTGKIIIVDYSWPFFGLGSEISAQVYARLFGKLSNKVEVLAGKDTHVAYEERLEKQFYPSKEELVALIEKVCTNIKAVNK